MNVSFNGIGQVCATFPCENAAEGHAVKLDTAGAAVECADGDRFCGAALCCRDGACTVQVRGFVTLPCSSGAPALGWTALAADGKGGVKPSAGSPEYLVADAADGMITILL